MAPGFDREKAELLHMLEVLEARALARVPGKEIFHLYLYQSCDSGFSISSQSGSRVLMTKKGKILQATGKGFSPQQRTPSTSKNEIYQPFPMFGGNFCSHRS
jgi:hypothetical protein